MRQWDYRKIDLNDLPRRSVDIDLLNAAGENGVGARGDCR